MAVRTYPTKRFGNVPQLDKHIKRGKSEDPTARFFAVGKPYANLTLARFAVQDHYGIRAKDFSGLAEYDARRMGRKPGFARPKPAPTKRSRAPIAVDITVGELKVSVKLTQEQCLEFLSRLVKST